MYVYLLFFFMYTWTFGVVLLWHGQFSQKSSQLKHPISCPLGPVPSHCLNQCRLLLFSYEFSPITPTWSLFHILLWMNPKQYAFLTRTRRQAIIWTNAGYMLVICYITKAYMRHSTSVKLMHITLYVRVHMLMLDMCAYVCLPIVFLCIHEHLGSYCYGTVNFLRNPHSLNTPYLAH